MLLRPLAILAVLALAMSTSVLTSTVSAGATSPITVGPINTVSAPCTGQNAEVEQDDDRDKNPQQQQEFALGYQIGPNCISAVPLAPAAPLNRTNGPYLLGQAQR